MLVTPSRSIAAEQLRQAAAVDLDGDDVDVGFGLAMASVEVPVPQPISSTTGARPAEPGVGVQLTGGAVGVAGLHAQFGPQPVPRLLLAVGEGRAPGAEAGDPGMQMRRGARRAPDRAVATRPACACIRPSSLIERRYPHRGAD